MKQTTTIYGVYEGDTLLQLYSNESHAETSIKLSCSKVPEQAAKYVVKPVHVYNAPEHL